MPANRHPSVAVEAFSLGGECSGRMSARLVAQRALSPRLGLLRDAPRRLLATPADYSLNEVGSLAVATSDGPDGAEGSTAAIAVVLKAGSRHEPGPGYAHVLKNFLFRVRSSPIRSIALLLFPSLTL